MRRYWIQSFFAVGFLILLAACDSDQLIAPEFITEVTVSIIGLEQSYSAPEGELIAAAFELEIRDLEGLPIGEIPAAICVVSGPGNVGIRDHYSTSDGLILALFYATTILGDTTSVIMAIAGHDTAYASVQIHGTIKPASISLSPMPDPFYIPHFGQPASTPVSATVLNPTGIPVPGIQVVFTTDTSSASITQSVVTDEAGVARADINFNGRWFGEMEITAVVVGEYNVRVSEFNLPNAVISGLIRNAVKSSLPATTDASPLIDRAVLAVELLTPLQLEFLTADTTVDFNPGSRSLPISLRLRESDNDFLPNEIIQLDTDPSIGTLPRSIITDEMGIAHTTLLLTGNPGEATINAEFEPLGISALMSVEVNVENTLAASMEFTNPGAAVWINSIHVIRIAVRYLNGGPGVGIPVNLLSQLGNSTDETRTTDQNGIVLIPYAPHNGGTEKLTLLIGGLENNDASLEFTVFAGEAHIEGAFEDGEGEERLTTKILRFRIYDDLNQGIPGERIEVSCTFGELDRNNIVTDLEGRGEVILHRAYGSGYGTMYVVWGQLSVSFDYFFPFLCPASIELRTELNQLSVEGNDSSSTNLIALVYDETGSLIDMPTIVVFEIVNAQNPPAGPSFGNGTAIDSAVTSEGIAVVTLRAGRQIGGLLLRAKTWRDEERTDEISIILSTVAVVAGPPHSADLDIDAVEDAGGSWSLPFSVRFWDIYRNPITRLFPFHFRSPLDGEVYTTSLRRWSIVYNSVNTFDSAVIEIWTDEEYGAIHVEREFVFPLVDGLLELNVDPQNIMLDEDLDEAVVRCWVVLTDGHQIRINNAPILFTSNRSRFYWKDFSNDQFIRFFPDPTRKYTGVVDRQNNEEPGVATVYLIGFEQDFFLDPFSLEVTVQINAVVEGYNDVQADPAFIFFSRSAGR